MKKLSQDRRSERGGAGAKLLMVLMVLILIANAGLNYVPVAYEAENFKQEMHTAVVQVMALPTNSGKPTEAIKSRIARAARDNNLPVDTFINVRQVDNIVQARVYYSKPVVILPLGLYTYDYEFDHTATPTGFLAKSFD